MTSRRASDGGGVLSFTFLDVLMCTMGSLLLLLVVFGVIAKQSTRARRAGEDAKISLSALATPRASAAPASDSTPPLETDGADDAGSLHAELQRLRSEQSELERLRTAASERRREEQARISHLEDHERRLEHDLGKLYVALKALDAAETEQVVDQQQADAEVARLKRLICETEERLSDMRRSGAGSKSYAIVPYKGANGTFRRPVFVECTSDAVTIQPEGLRLTVADFDGPLRSGNPLAAAIRAAHEELNGRAAAAGQTDMPDPYPLLIVRPGGAAAYAAALDSIRSWDSDYGYEFVEADWKLKYPEPDPRLGQVMAHAIDEARQRQALLAKVAPRRYGSRLALGGDGLGGTGLEGDGIAAGAGGGGGGFQALGGGALDRIGSHAGDGALGGGAGTGNTLRGQSGRYAGGSRGNFIDEFAAPVATGHGEQVASSGAGGTGYGGGGGGGSGVRGRNGGLSGAEGVRGQQGRNDGPRYDSAPRGASMSGSQLSGSGHSGQTGGNNELGGAGDAAGGGTTVGATGNAAASTTAADGRAATSAAGGAASSASAGGASGSNMVGSGGGGMGGIQPIELGKRRRSAADSRGANWANAEASRKASAITRPIKVIVKADGLTVLDSDGQAAPAGTITFQQPIDGVMDQLAAAVQTQISEWGLAGDNMYWRPTLVASIAPGAERQAQRLAELFENSGVDIRLPQATARATGRSGHAPR